jgi:hypothetical protein
MQFGSAKEKTTQALAYNARTLKDPKLYLRHLFAELPLE